MLLVQPVDSITTLTTELVAVVVHLVRLVQQDLQETLVLQDLWAL